MTEQEPMAVVVQRIEIRQAINPTGGQSLVLIAGPLPNGNEAVIALTPAEARSTAKTMVTYADEIEPPELHGRIVKTIAVQRSADPLDPRPVGVTVTLHDGEMLAAPLTIDAAKAILEDLEMVIAEAEAVAQQEPPDLQN